MDLAPWPGGLSLCGQWAARLSPGNICSQEATSHGEWWWQDSRSLSGHGWPAVWPQKSQQHPPSPCSAPFQLDAWPSGTPEGLAAGGAGMQVCWHQGHGAAAPYQCHMEPQDHVWAVSLGTVLLHSRPRSFCLCGLEQRLRLKSCENPGFQLVLNNESGVFAQLPLGRALGLRVPPVPALCSLCWFSYFSELRTTQRLPPSSRVTCLPWSESWGLLVGIGLPRPLIRSKAVPGLTLRALEG